MESLKSVVGGLLDIVGLRSPDPFRSEHGHGNMDASHEEHSEWWLVSQQSATNSRYPYNKCILLQLKLGSVAEEEADVLVSSVGRDLDLSKGMISKCMLMKAGDAMQQELRASYPSGIHEFEFAVSAAHRLPCKAVLHVACGSYRDEVSSTMFASVIYRCLQYASCNRMKSIAFPPIGTGNLGYAPQMVAKLFYEATTEFLKNCPNQSLEHLILAVFDDSLYKIFKSTLDRLMPDARVAHEINHQAGESMNAYHQKETERLLVSQQSPSKQFSMSAAQQFSQSKGKSEQEQNEWWLVSQQPTASSREAGGKYPGTQGLLLQLKIGSVAEEQADILVSSVGHDLNLSQGMISKSMLQKAGDAMQNELYERYPNGIQEFEFAVSAAHRLSCKSVLHVACGQFEDEKSKTKIASALRHCLQHASDYRMKSIVFPPIGTGNLGYAAQMVAELFFTELTVFLKNSNQSLEVVTLAVVDFDTYQIFKSTFDRMMMQESRNAYHQEEAKGLLVSQPSATKEFSMSVARQFSQGKDTSQQEQNERWLLAQQSAESRNAYHQEEAKGLHVSQPSATKEFSMSAAERFSQSKGTSEQEQNEWWLVSQQSAGEHFAAEDNKEAQFGVKASQNSPDLSTSEECAISMENNETIQSPSESAEGGLLIKGPAKIEGNTSRDTKLAPLLDNRDRNECLTSDIPGRQLPMAGQQDGNVLEFAAPLNVNEEHVALHLSDITNDKQVECKKESCILRVSFDEEEAFQQIVNTRELKIGEHELTRLMIDSGPYPPTTARQGGIADSCPFVFLSLHVDSRVHITKHCLGELMNFLEDQQYSLHRTAVPGELVLEWRGPESQRHDQLVTRKIYEYADSFVTIVVEISEQTANGNLRKFLTDPPTSEMSCIKIGQRCKDQLYIITCKKSIVSRCHRWLLPCVTRVHHSLLMPFNSAVGLESKANPDAAATKPKMHRCVEEEEGVTLLAAKDVESRVMSAPVVTNDARLNGNSSTISLSHAASEQITEKSEVAGGRAGSNRAAHRTTSSDQPQAGLRSTDSPSEPSPGDVVANRFPADAFSTSTFDDTLTQSPSEPPPGDVAANRFPADACSTLIFDDTLAKVQQESSTFSSTDQPPSVFNSDSLLVVQDDDQQKTRQSVQKQSLPSSEMDIPQQQMHGLLRMHGQSSQLNSALSIEAYAFLPAQTEEQWLAEQERIGTPLGRVHLWSNISTSTSRVQGNEQSRQQCSEFSIGMNEPLHAQTEKQWLEEQERNGTPRGRVHLWSYNSASIPTTRRQLEHEQNVSEATFSVKNQKLMSTKPGSVIPKHTSNAPAYDKSKVQLQQRGKPEIESRAAVQAPTAAWNPSDSQGQEKLLENAAHRRIQAITKTHAGNDGDLASERLCDSRREYGHTGASRNVSSHIEKTVNCSQQSDV